MVGLKKLLAALGSLLFVSVVLVGCGTNKPPEIVAAEKELPAQLDYNYHVKPILSDRCFACHGPDKNKRGGGLRLDTHEGATAALGKNKDHYAIVPGNLAESEVFKRITSKDKDMVMPPVESHLTLSPKEIATLARWIEEGAEYKPHWSFIKPGKPAIPVVKNEKWVKNPIDAFVLARLEGEKRQPSPEADKESLIRRVSFDLTGLPPTIAQIDSFLADSSPTAYEKLVDHLLASPAYGERMAQYWLDVSRFADSHGYLDDKHRPMWPWRDWVIKAFNQNLPFDQFTTWQLAGDLLPNATKEQILATGFNRNHKQNGEGGVIPEEFRVENVADRAQTTAKAFLGLTMECARCHDHKYDPLTQKNYYQLFAFFNSTFERGNPVYGGPDQVPGPSLLLSSDEADKKLAFIRTSIHTQEQQVSQPAVQAQAAFTNWLKANNVAKAVDASIRQKQVAYYPFDEIKSNGSSPNKRDPKKPAQAKEVQLVNGLAGKALKIDENNSVILGQGIGLFERTDPFSVSLAINAPTVYDGATVFFHADHERYGYKGYDLLLLKNRLQFRISHSWPHNTISVITKKPIQTKQWTHITLTYDGSSRAKGMKIYVDGKLTEVEVEYDHLYKSIIPTPNIHIVSQFLGFRTGHRDNDKSFTDGLFDELQLFTGELSALEVARLANHPSFQEAISHNTNAQTLLQGYFLLNHYQPFTELRRQLWEKRRAENQLLDSIPEMMVMGDLPTPRPTYVLQRGVYDAYGERVEPGTPESILPFPKNLPKNRLGLAKWVVSRENPLTARVTVNRFWQMHFGKGLVTSSDDLGNQGSLPSHPELLDWLAVHFMESGWNMKALHRLMVTSATYRQSSHLTKDWLEKDPTNRLFARGPRHRLPAEMIRDNALTISGLLSKQIGGPSVYPYQPTGLWEALSDKVWRYHYIQAKDEGLYRKSIYTVWKRTSPPPSMLIFDAPDRNLCAVKRNTTSTPLQALVLLNDPQYVEASKFVAERMVKEGGNDLAHQLMYGFRLVTGRRPLKQEQQLMTNLYREEWQRFRADPAKTAKYLSTGEKKVDPQLNPPHLAALAVVANTLMNTSECYTKR